MVEAEGGVTAAAAQSGSETAIRTQNALAVRRTAAVRQSAWVAGMLDSADCIHLGGIASGHGSVTAAGTPENVRLFRHCGCCLMVGGGEVVSH